MQNGTEKMSANRGKLSLIVFSGAFEKVHYALALAAGALAVNRTVTLFFTMEAARALMRNANDKPGWHDLAADGGQSAFEKDAQFKKRGVADFETLLQSVVELEGRFMVCEMGLRALGLSESALRPDVPFTPGGIATFLEDAEQNGAMLFV